MDCFSHVACGGARAAVFPRACAEATYPPPSQRRTKAATVPSARYLLYIGRPFKILSFSTPEFIMPKLPPGPSLILRRLFSWEVVGYSGFIYLLRAGTKRIGTNVPLWVILSSSVVTFPALFLVQSQLDYWRNQRKARSLGGRLVPTVPTRWPGGIELVTTMLNVFKTGYLGELSLRSCDGVLTWHRQVMGS